MQTHVPKHIIGVDALVVNDRDEVLLIRSPKRGWEFPGGQVEEGETLTDALVREVREETGVTVSVGNLVGVYSSLLRNIVMFGFICRYQSGEPTTSEESLEVKWVARDAALERISAPYIYDRLKDKLDFEGDVIYRAYNWSREENVYEVIAERGI